MDPKQGRRIGIVATGLSGVAAGAYILSHADQKKEEAKAVIGNMKEMGFIPQEPTFEENKEAAVALFGSKWEEHINDSSLTEEIFAGVITVTSVAGLLVFGNPNANKAVVDAVEKVKGGEVGQAVTKGFAEAKSKFDEAFAWLKKKGDDTSKKQGGDDEEYDFGDARGANSPEGESILGTRPGDSTVNVQASDARLGGDEEWLLYSIRKNMYETYNWAARGFKNKDDVAMAAKSPSTLTGDSVPVSNVHKTVNAPLSAEDLGHKQDVALASTLGGILTK